jgi:hypothetical protein
MIDIMVPIFSQISLSCSAPLVYIDLNVTRRPELLAYEFIDDPLGGGRVMSMLPMTGILTCLRGVVAPAGLASAWAGFSKV